MSRIAQKRKTIPKRRADRRIEKTKNALRGALHELIAEKPYDAISVNDILTRADVGRSTFYIHFRDKDDLLSSTISDIAAPATTQMKGGVETGFDRILGFALPVFEHHGQRTKSGNHLMSGRARAILHQHLQREISSTIVESMASFRPSPDLVARFVASSFILVLDWWLNSRSRLSPQAADDIFRSLVVPSLTSLDGSRTLNDPRDDARRKRAHAGLKTRS